MRSTKKASNKKKTQRSYEPCPEKYLNEVAEKQCQKEETLFQDNFSDLESITDVSVPVDNKNGNSSILEFAIPKA